MKKIITSIIVTILASHAFVQAQTNHNSSDKSQLNTTRVDGAQNDNTVTYRLFPTQNTWTFIKLNTRNGKMWQVQWSFEIEKRFETILNPTALITKEEEVNGRFTLYSTQNFYNFILIDQLDGRTWQVQWSIEEDKRAIVPIF
jgi:hypothetical protein